MVILLKLGGGVEVELFIIKFVVMSIVLLHEGNGWDSMSCFLEGLESARFLRLGL